MQKKVPVYAVVLIALASIVATFEITLVLIGQNFSSRLSEEVSQYSKFSKLIEIDKVVSDEYIGEMDEKTLLEGAINGYFGALGDKYSYYLSSEDMDEMMNGMDSKFVGIGVHVIYDSENYLMEVISVINGSPSMEADIEPGDKIYKIEGQTVEELGYYGALAEIKGDEGSKVKVTVIRDNKEIDFTLTRAAIEEETVEYRLLTDPDTKKESNVGFVRISEFDNNTGDHFVSAVNELKKLGAKSLVIDLRNNPGGELNSVLTALDFVLPEGPIINTTDSKGNKETEYSDAAYLDMELAILVNENSASAAELFTSAVKDYAHKGQIKATVIGTLTYGKGIMQVIQRFEDGSGMSLTYKEFSPPYSESYHGKGVVPDVELELSDEAKSVNFYKLTEDMDNQLQYALKMLLGKSK